jgi:hypothetical protein
MGWVSVFTFAVVLLGMFFLFEAGENRERGKKGLSSFSIGLGMFCIAFAFFIFHSEINDGSPVELKRDGIYEVRVIDTFIDEGISWVGVLVLKEEGKTDSKPALYRKIPASLLKPKEIFMLGSVLTIQVRTVKEHREAVVKN